MLPQPEIHAEPPPKFRTGEGADDLTLIKGIGPTYRDRLTSEGVGSFRALSDRNPEDIAEIAGTSTSVAESWVKSASALAL